MILEEKYFYREGDNPKMQDKFRRRHLLARCDDCGEEGWKIYHSFIKSACYHKNNKFNKDFCRPCRFNNVPRKKRDKRTMKEGEFLPKRKKERIVYHSAGYRRAWITDSNHPRLNKNKRDKSPKGGRVYEHVLEMEKHIGRYLTKTECVHHVDGNKANNNIENLFLCKDTGHHRRLHAKMERFVFALMNQDRVVFDKVGEEFKLVTLPKEKTVNPAAWCEECLAPHITNSTCIRW